MIYNPKNWFWVVAGSASQVYSSAAAAYLPEADAGYVAWVAAGGYATRIASEAELVEVLAAQYPAGWKDAKRYVPVAIARERLEALGQWEAAAAAIAADPAILLKVATLQEGLDVADPVVLALLAAVGADPAVVLA